MPTAPASPTSPASATSFFSAPPIIKNPFILVPLYIYPNPAVWEPLYAAAAEHPELDFLVVVNPGDGPGPDILPDANYIEELTRLAALRNVRVIGYVYCGYGTRMLDEIVADVSAYRGWTEAYRHRFGKDGKTIVVDGIFIDEAPSSTEFVQYLATLSRAAKTILNYNTKHDDAEVENGQVNGQEEATAVAPNAEAAGWSPTSTSTCTTSGTGPPTLPPLTIPGALPPPSEIIVIYNPGVIVDPIFYQEADYVVAFENASGEWTTPDVRQGFARLPRPLRERSIAIAHSASESTVEAGQISRMAAEAGCLGQFVTTRPGYTDWCPSWAKYVQEMARRGL